MFEAAEVGHTLSKAQFARQVPPLRERLLLAQTRLREARVPLIVIVSGVEMAGKSEVVSHLTQWLDARTVRTVAFWDESDEERERPDYWRFWRQLPAAGSIALLLGSWYTDPIVRRATRRGGRKRFEAQLARVIEFERTLSDGGALFVKLWFHISRDEQARRLRELKRRQARKLTDYEKGFARHYDRFAAASESAIRATDLGHAPWQIVDAFDRRHRDLTAAQALLDAIERRLAVPAAPRVPAVPAPGRRRAGRTVLSAVDLGAKLASRTYERELEALQARLDQLAWKARNRRRSTVVVFEGWDAAGKGGAIRRIAQGLDARLFRVIPVAAPTDEELAHHYLWRFWRQLPRAGYFTLYDRSWYGRVLVERVEGYARAEEWARAYGEINAFEEQLTGDGICLVKFWLHISAAEQLRRFHEREKIVYKRYKITADDWRNRKQRAAYETAVDEMVARTSTLHAPWTLVAGEDKRFGRIEVLRTLCEALERALDR